MPRTPASLIAATVAGALLTSCGTGDDLSGPDVAATPTATNADPTPAITDDPLIEPTGTDSPATTEEPAAGSTGTVIVVTVSGGEVTGVEERVTVPVGSDVTLEVTADVDDQLHVHGYDLQQEVVAGEATAVTFTADIPGIFEVELEDAEILLTKLEVR